MHPETNLTLGRVLARVMIFAGGVAALLFAVWFLGFAGPSRAGG